MLMNCVKCFKPVKHFQLLHIDSVLQKARFLHHYQAAHSFTPLPLLFTCMFLEQVMCIVQISRSRYCILFSSSLLPGVSHLSNVGDDALLFLYPSAFIDFFFNLGAAQQMVNIPVICRQHTSSCHINCRHMLKL